MNLIHRRLCRSATWHNVLREYVVPWVLKDVSLGSNLLELGPGHGLTTELLRPHVTHLTALEIDARLADSLAVRFTNSNVTGGRAAMPRLRPSKDAQSPRRFACICCITFIPPDLQDKVFREVWRVSSPGLCSWGWIVSACKNSGCAPSTWGTRSSCGPDHTCPALTDGGVQKVSVDANPHAFRFHAQRPAEGS